MLGSKANTSLNPKDFLFILYNGMLQCFEFSVLLMKMC